MLSKAQIKYIQSLQHKKYRQKSGQFIAEGEKVVQELLQTGLSVKAVYATERWLQEQSVLLAGKPAVEVVAIDEATLKQLSALSTPNRALALLDIPAEGSTKDIANSVTLALETIQDPGNMGTLIRIADWFGISQVVCSPDCVDVYNPKTIQATMGSIARVRIITLPLLPWLHTCGVPAYAATLHGQDLTGFSTLKEGIILIGNESRGLSQEVIAASRYRVTIPRIGGAESLNAAVAAGIICSHLTLPAAK